MGHIDWSRPIISPHSPVADVELDVRALDANEGVKIVGLAQANHRCSWYVYSGWVWPECRARYETAAIRAAVIASGWNGGSFVLGVTVHLAREAQP